MALLKKYYYMGLPDSLLAKYVVNETTNIESDRVEEWMAANDKNRKYVEGLFMIIANCRQVQKITPENEKAAWENFWQRTENSKTSPTPIRSIYYSVKWVKVAAILILIVGAAGLLYTINRQKVQPSLVMKEIQGDGIRTDTLPDGSQVLLGNNAKMFYPSLFTDSQRNVELKGTCFFSVAPDIHKPFRIKADDILVTVIGTSFTIKSDSGKTEIIVHRGIVEVTRHNHSLKLFRDEKLSVLATDTTLVKALADTSPPAKRLSVTQQNATKKIESIPTDEIGKQKKIVRNIILDIIGQHIVEKNSIKWFGLTDKEFIINGAKQPENIHQKFSKKYPVKHDYGFYYGLVKMAGKGVFITKEDINQ